MAGQVTQLRGHSCWVCEPDHVFVVKTCQLGNPAVVAPAASASWQETCTLAQGSKLSLQVWAMAFYLLTTDIKGTLSLMLHRDLDVTRNTAWHLAHRIFETWREQGLATAAGPIEGYETLIGGRESNGDAQQKLNGGSGSVDKAAATAVKDRVTGTVSAEVVPDTSRASLQGFVRARTADGAMVYTDNFMDHRGLPTQEMVGHQVGKRLGYRDLVG